MDTNVSYGKQHVAFRDFTNCVIVIGFYVIGISLLCAVASLLGGSATIDMLIQGVFCFGVILAIEGVVASLFDEGGE
jgi:hypothetical protein